MTSHGKENDQIIDHRSLLCKECWHNIFDTDTIRAFWQREPGAFEYTANILHILEASKYGCNWCEAFLSIIGVSSLEDWHRKALERKEPQSNQTAEFNVFMEWAILTDPGREPSDKCRLFVGHRRRMYEIAWCAYESKNPFVLIETKSPRPDLSSNEVFEQVKQWMEICKKHSSCLQMSSDSLPKRVIEVAPLDSTGPSRLRESSDLSGPYLALSYCWGEQSYVLATETKEDLMIGLDESKLPQTILDAIHVTRQLGYRFLWVDALCIVQNSAMEKAEDIANMDQIYQRASLTIIAGSASSASEGFLYSKRPISHMLTDVQRNPNKDFKIPCKYGVNQYTTVGVKELEPSSSFMDPLVRRAWTLQETLLSSRVLSYSCHTLTWNCKAASFRLDDWYYPDRDSYEQLAQNITPDQSHRDISRKWDTIVKLYTDRALTVSEDKLPALAAVAAVFSPVLGPNYLAGIWKSTLPEALLWMPESGYPEAEVRSFVSADPYEYRFARRPRNYRAPTWSWASIDGFVIYDHDKLSDRKICTALECKTIPKYSIVPFGEVTSGHIKLRCRMRQLCLRPRSPRNSFIIWPDWGPSVEDDKSSQPTLSQRTRLHIDTEDDLYDRTIYCIPITEIDDRMTPYDTRGLLLVLDESGNRTYKRIGIFGGFWEDFDGVEEEIITII